jgi:CheY-like chemotaxis protein
MGLRLLMIDDEVDLGESLREILKDNFDEIVLCHTPDQALEICLSSTFDLIISDHNMAQLSGLELLKILRSEGVMPSFTPM